MSSKTILTFVGVNRGVPGDDWWDWDVRGVDPRDWSSAEVADLIGWADYLITERFRGECGSSRAISYTFVRETMACNMRAGSGRVSPFR